MPADEKDAGYLLDMLLAGCLLRKFTSGIDWESFRSDTVLQSAVQYQELVLGEAANLVTPAFRRSHPEIPWDRLVGMRHRLVHGYREVELRRVWRFIENDLLRLIATLESLVPPEQPDSPAS